MCKNKIGTRSGPGIGSKPISESPSENSATDMAQFDKSSVSLKYLKTLLSI